MDVANNGDIPECPLCLEPLGLDDINFYPCACRYQICRFCWHRIRTDENSLCPHCREVYPENPAEYTPPTAEQLAKIKSEKKQKEQFKRQKVVESREKLASVRVVQKNLVFVIGLSPRLADPEVLKRNEYFGKFGKIYKVVINNHTIYNGAQGPSVSAYVTYCRNEDASKAIAAVNNAFIDGRSLKASFGTTKYCTSFLKGTLCTKPDCMYLHELGEDEASFTKEDMQLGKHQVFETATLASMLPPATNKDHVPSTMAEGGVKIKHTVIPRNKDPVAPDTAESALPATAHWASNQKAQGGGGGNDDSSEQSNFSTTNKPSKNLSTSKIHGTGTEDLSMSHSSSKQSGSTSVKKVMKENAQKQDNLEQKSGSRSGSVSPNTQKNSQSRTSSSDSISSKRQTGREKIERDGVRTNHSRGSSLTKSFTPNLSPKSTLSTSSSSGSLKQEGEDTSDVVVGVSSGAELPRRVERSGEGDVDSMRSCDRVVISEDHERTAKVSGIEDMQVNSVTSQSGGTSLNRKLEAGSHTSNSKTIKGPREAAAFSSVTPISNLPPVTVLKDKGGVMGTSPPISSPPGLSKTKQGRDQPLPLSTQSALVCRQLDLSVSKPSPQLSLEVAAANHKMHGQNPPTGTSDEQELHRIEHKASHSHTPAVQTESLANNVINSFTSAGTSHFGSLGVNWNIPTTTTTNSASPLLPPPPPTAPHGSTLPQSKYHYQPPTNNPSNIPVTSSQYHAPNPTLPGSFITSSSSQPQSRKPNLPFPPSGLFQSKPSDDADELGFDPWDVSHQGLADLLETEAEQKQQKPHTLGATLGHPSTASRKGTPNGFTTPFMGQENYKSNWQGLTPPVTTTAAVGSGNFDSSEETLQDEFRALFPNVNVSFGGTSSKSKGEKPSPLVQALNATSSSSSYPTHLATALNYSYHAPRPPSSQGHAHLAVGGKKQGLYSSDISTAPLGGVNLFLGHSQPGFPSSCFKVKAHSDELRSNAPTTNSATSSSATCTTSEGTTSYTSCLGPDWPDLGITLGQGAKAQSRVGGERGVSKKNDGGELNDVSTLWKVPGGASSTGESSALVSVTSTITTASSALPSPPPGFSKSVTPLSGPAHSEGVTSSAGPTATGAGTGFGNQTTTTTTANPVPPLLIANSKAQVPNQFLQSWSNFRNLTPAQQQQHQQQLQQLARTNQLTYQQLITQQYLFQQAMLRNPLLQAQSLRMAHLHQQALLKQQQQQAAMKAAGVIPTSVSGTAKMNSTGVVMTSSSGAPLFVSLGGSASVSNMSTVAASVSQTGSKITTIGSSSSVGSSISSTSTSSKSSMTKTSQQNGALKGQDGRNSGLSNASKLLPSGHSKNSSQVSSSQSSSSFPSGGLNSRTSDRHHYTSMRSQRTVSKPPKGASAHNSSSNVDKKSRQKPLK